LSRGGSAPARRQARPGRGRASSEERRDLLWAAALSLLAWIHRLALLRSNRDWDWPFTIFYEGDSETFFRAARALLAGEPIDNGIPFHPPGFAFFLAAIHSFLGAGAKDATVPHAAVKAVLALVGGLAIGLLYLLVRPYLGRTVALLSALLCLYHFGLSVLAIAPVSEGLYLFLLLAALLVWSRRFDHPLAAPGSDTGRSGGRGAALLLGLLLGGLALTRAEGVLVAVILVGVGGVGARVARRDAARLAPWAWVIVCGLLVVLPWTVRNAVQLGAANERLAGRLAEPLPRFVPITLYGPLNLALANGDGADGTFSRRLLASGASAPVLDLANPEHLHLLLHGDAVAWSWIRTHPAGFGQLVLRKWGIFLRAWELGWTQWDWPGGLFGERLPVDVFVPESRSGRLLQRLTIPLALLGLLGCLLAPGGPRRWALLVLLLTFSGLATTALFFGYVRQGLLLLPFGLTLVVAGLAWPVEGLLRRAPWRAGLTPSAPARPLLLGLGALALLLLSLEAWGAGADRNYRATGSTVAGERYLNRDEKVFLEMAP
jgi:hypothetical protein